MSAPAVAALIRTSKPQYRNADDRVVYALHAWMLTRGYKLVATGTQALESTGSTTQPEITLESFDSMLNDDYALLYADVDEKGSKKPVVLRCVKLGDKLIINQLVDNGINTHSVSVDVHAHADTEQYKDLPGLLGQFDATLAPAQDITTTSGGGAGPGDSGAHKPTAQPTTTMPDTEAPSTRGGASRHEYDPLMDVQQPMPLYGGVGGGVGRSDLYPPGMGPLLDPTRGPGLPGGGGMHVGPGDPLFSGGMRGGPPLPGSLPPGGRWDPIGPPGLPGFGPDDFTRGPRRGPHPDVQPPGPGRGADWDNMFG